jgi:ATP-dependent Lon protease
LPESACTVGKPLEEIVMSTAARLPVLPLRDIIVFPLATMPLLAGRAKSLQACEEALTRDGQILLLAQRNSAVEEPFARDLYSIGVVATLVQHLKLPDGKMKLLARGVRRAKVERLIDDPLSFAALAEPIDEPGGDAASPRSFEFSLADWAIDRSTNTQNRVAALQRILEDKMLSPAERLRAAEGLIGGG